MAAQVIPFRPRKQENTFSEADIRELHRWASAAGCAGFFFQTDRNPRTGKEHWIGRADCGSEFVSIALSSPSSPLLYVVTREGGRWVLRDRRFKPLDTFVSLRAALEAICATL